MPIYNLNFDIPTHASFAARIDWALMEVLLDHINEVVLTIDNRPSTHGAYMVLILYFEMLNRYQEYFTAENALIHAESALRRACNTHFHRNTHLEGLLCNLDSVGIINIISPLLTPCQ